MTDASLKVWEKIAAAFPPTLPRQPITTCDCEECRGVRANLGGLRWNEILPPAIDKHFGSLPLLHDGAFQALLPAFLFHALADLNPENKFLEFTQYALCSAYEEDRATTEAADKKLHERIVVFTEPQRASIRAFLELVAAEPDLAFHHEPSVHALSAIWR
jgi:hypothetical protein